jgi:hypothetical protein
LIWSLKESFVKARGDGIVFDLHRIEFSNVQEVALGTLPSSSLCVAVDSVAAPEWHFDAQFIDEHWFTTSRCPPCNVIDANGQFLASMKKREFSDAEWLAEATVPWPPFCALTLNDLMPADQKSQFNRIVQD